MADKEVNMQINRYNYEEYFLLYTDDELNTQDREAVEEFVAMNPDLKEELALLQQYTLVPEELVFPDKSSLLKIAGNDFIHAGNYETCFLLYADNELNDHDRECVEQFVQDHPRLKQEFDLIGKAVLTSDDSIHFPDRDSLLRHENGKVIGITWWKMAAAAVVLLVAGTLWLNNGSPIEKHAIAQNKHSEPSKLETAAGNSKSIKSDAPVSQTTNNQASSAAPDYAVAKKEVTGSKASHLSGNKRGTDNVKQVAQLVNNHVRQVQSQVENTVKQVQAANNTAFNTISSAVIKNQQSVIDEAVTFSSSIPDSGNTNSEAIFASGNETNDVYVSNIPLDKKHALRGLFRKASRMINKATGINTGEKGILIGNIELALK